MSDVVSSENTPKTGEWEQKLSEVVDFASKNGRWPGTTSKSPEEKNLAQWWARIKYYHKKFVQNKAAPGMDQQRADTITDIINKFDSLERDGIWNTTFEKCKNKVEADKVLWSYKDADNAKIVRWWNQQKTFYRKFRKGIRVGGMTAPRADLVESLLKMLGEEVLPQQAMQDENPSLQS